LILSAPDVQGASAINASVDAREEFFADGAFAKPDDGRVYLHLQDGRGWICERHRHDFSRFVVEPCDKTILGNDLEDCWTSAAATATNRREHSSSTGQKIVVVERDVNANYITANTDGELARVNARELRAAEAKRRSVVFRSDQELWPDECGPAKPIDSTLRAKLRRAHFTFGASVLECEGDIREVEERVGSFARSCPAQKDLQQYAATLRTEVTKRRKEWVIAVEEALRGGFAEETKQEVMDHAPNVAVFPAQVRGERWYYARVLESDCSSRGADNALKPLRATTEEPLDEGVGAAVFRRMGPLRVSSSGAELDLKRLQSSVRVDGEGSSKRRCAREDRVNQSGLIVGAAAAAAAGG